MNKTKYIFITGGVVSGLGKGITAASLGRLLKSRGLKVTAQKLDPYLNVDPGTMNPVQHGEVFVTDDGAETDLDLGSGRLRKRGEHQGCQRRLNNCFHSNLHQHHCRSDQKTVPNWNWNFWVLSPSSFLSA